MMHPRKKELGAVFFVQFLILTIFQWWVSLMFNWHSLCRDLSSLVLQFNIFKFINFWQPVHLLLFTRHFKIFLTFDYRIPKCIPHITHSFPCNSILSREIPWVTVYSIQTAFYILLFSLTPPPLAITPHHHTLHTPSRVITHYVVVTMLLPKP